MSNILGWWALVNVLFGGFMAAAGAGWRGLLLYGFSWIVWYYYVLLENEGGPGNPA